MESKLNDNNCTFWINTVYKSVRIMGGGLPISYRVKNVFRTSATVLALNWRSGVLEESHDDKLFVLATLDMKRPRFRHQGINGTAVLVEGDSITIKRVDGLRHRIVVNSREHGTWDFCNHEEGERFLFRHRGTTLAASDESPFHDAEHSHRVYVKCDVSMNKLAKVLGVFVCAILFDYAWDAGGHV